MKSFRNKSIYLVRHGETVWNSVGRFQGQLNSALTQRGIEQAEQVGTILAQEIKDHSFPINIHISPLGRARETASILTRHVDLPSREEPRISEVTLGSWDGMTHYEIDTEYPGLLTGADAFDWYFRSPDGETFDSACVRVKAWLSDLSVCTIAISHGLTGRLIRGLYLGLPMREMLELPVPQNGFFKLHDGGVEFIAYKD
ncbi:histidine phosphatase family protein [Phyllobacterium sp. TAF24]|uniref:histidine phosphatase family protein n=1 Tax=Phyllobacterium sp. TAF24 TaxID=3233068 RepID=UPI003F9E549A